MTWNLCEGVCIWVGGFG